MPDPEHRIARVRSVFEAALTDADLGAGWTPPAPEALAALFPGYQLEALLGRGGMGAVYRARQISLDRLVAIKLLPFELGVEEGFAERFRREATALARLSHPNIVAVHDFGQADDGHFFMVMEYVAGTDLAARLREGPIPPAEAIEVVRQVCDALEFAHAQGVVHRDIKPGNILLEASGRVKVADFGLAQLAGDEPRTALTAAGALLGTPEYVAPEQTRSATPVDHRADIFSLGVMLYELLTGQLPRGVFRPLAQCVPAGRALDRVVTRALQSEPAQRFGAVSELRLALLECDPKRRRKRGWRVALLTVSAAGLAIFAWQKLAAPAPFLNSLGLRFVPAGTPGVLFCTTETRRRDFAAFATVRNFKAYGPIWMNFTGLEQDWKMLNGTWQQPGFPQTDEHPVVGVTWDEAHDFAAWLTEHERRSERIGPEDSYRLPTSAEWSVAAGLSTDAHFPSGRFPWGQTFPPKEKVAGNYASEETRAAGGTHAALRAIAGYHDGYPFTAPAGSFAANAHGLHDLGGNVWEWTAGGDGDKKPLRGASWWDASAEKLDAAREVLHERNLRCYCFGFRLVLERKLTATRAAR